MKRRVQVAHSNASSSKALFGNNRMYTKKTASTSQKPNLVEQSHCRKLFANAILIIAVSFMSLLDLPVPRQGNDRMPSRVNSPAFWLVLVH